MRKKRFLELGSLHYQGVPPQQVSVKTWCLNWIMMANWPNSCSFVADFNPTPTLLQTFKGITSSESEPTHNSVQWKWCKAQNDSNNDDEQLLSSQPSSTKRRWSSSTVLGSNAIRMASSPATNKCTTAGNAIMKNILYQGLSETVPLKLWKIWK